MRGKRVKEKALRPRLPFLFLAAVLGFTFWFSGLPGLLAFLLLIGIGSVVRGVETTPLEDDSGASAEETADLPPALGAALSGRLGHRLEHFELVAALLAFVFVRRHQHPPVTFDPARPRTDSDLPRYRDHRWRTKDAGALPCRRRIPERKRSAPRRSGNHSAPWSPSRRSGPRRTVRSRR